MGSINRHFKFGSNRMIAFILLLVLLGMLASFLAPIVLRHLAIDRCLDQGGAYDPRAHLCRMK